MNIQIEVDTDYAFGREIFGDRPPIPQSGALVKPFEGVTLTVDHVVEQRTRDPLVTIAITVGIVANTAFLVQFASWLCVKLKSRPKATLRIAGKTCRHDLDDIVKSLEELASRSSGS